MAPTAFEATFEGPQGPMQVALDGPHTILGQDLAPVTAWRLDIQEGQRHSVYWLDADLRTIRHDFMCVPTGPTCQYVTVNWYRAGEPAPLGIGILNAFRADVEWRQGPRPLDADIAVARDGDETVVTFSAVDWPLRGMPLVNGAVMSFDQGGFVPQSIDFGDQGGGRYARADVIWGERLAPVTTKAAIDWMAAPVPRSEGTVFPGADKVQWPDGFSVDAAAGALTNLSESARQLLAGGGCITYASSHAPQTRGGSDVVVGLPGTYTAVFLFGVGGPGSAGKAYQVTAARDNLTDQVTWEAVEQQDLAFGCDSVPRSPWPAMTLSQARAAWEGLPVSGAPFSYAWSALNALLHDRPHETGLDDYAAFYTPGFAEGTSGAVINYNIEMNANPARLVSAVVHPDDLAAWDARAATRS